MSYSIQDVNTCTKKLTFNFESLDLSTEIKTALVKKQKTASIKGFRKGKAPLSMIEKIYGPHVEHEALNQFVQNKFYDAITKENLRVVGYPAIDNMNYDAGKSISFDATVEIFPEFSIKDYSSYSFTKDSVEVLDEDIDRLEKNYLEQKSEMVEVTEDKTLEVGDFAVMNFQGEKEDGERPENMKGEEFVLEIGSGQFIPGFEDGMKGMKKGEKKELDLSFPDTYHVEDLKNAKVKFEVELLEIKKKNFPEFTDELAKEFGFESVEDFKTKNKKTLEAQKERQSREKLNQEILEKLVGDNDFDIPSALVKQQEDFLKEDLTKTLKQQGFTDVMVDEYFDKWNEDLNSKAVFQVRSGLILDTLAKEFEVTTTEDDINLKIEEMAAQSGMDSEQIKQYYTSNERLKANLTHAIREEKTFDKIIEKVKIS